MADGAPGPERPSARARLRSGGGVAAFAVLLVSLAGPNPVSDVRRRVEALRRSSAWSASDRRLAGMSAAYDRRFFEFVRAARASLPPGARGVALYAPRIPTWGGLFLAVYTFAPVPVLLAPPRVPPGWVALEYASGKAPSALPLLRALPGGAMVGPAP